MSRSKRAAPADLPLPTLDGQLCFALYSTMNAVNRNYAPILGALDLTYSQYLVMLVLWERDDIAVGEIGRRLFLDSGTLTPLLKRLETAGLVVRRRNPADERQVRIGLTANGQALRDKARSLPVEIGRAMGRSAEEIAVLRDDLLRLRTSLLASLDGRQTNVADPAP